MRKDSRKIQKSWLLGINFCGNQFSGYWSSRKFTLLRYLQLHFLLVIYNFLSFKADEAVILKIKIERMLYLVINIFAIPNRTTFSFLQTHFVGSYVHETLLSLLINVIIQGGLFSHKLTLRRAKVKKEKYQSNCEILNMKQLLWLSRRSSF